MGKYLLIVVLGILITGCGKEPASRYDNYTLQGTVYFGGAEIAGDSVEMTHWAYEDTTTKQYIDTVLTDSIGQYRFEYVSDTSHAFNMPFKVRAMKSTGVWSPFQLDTVGPNETVTLDFHL
ncbi:MAG: hypothetical protein PHE49_05795 [bacterium]|nr:hypothetical protein [bacterium]